MALNYRGFSLQELTLEYSPRATVGGDFAHYLEAYAALSAAARHQLSVRENLPYGQAPQQILDYFDGPDNSAPLHIFIHGGYWQALDQRVSSGMAPGIVEDGFAFATLNYTLAPQGRIGDMVDECRSALDWFSQNTKELGFDPSQVILSGHSAGAHLAAMILSLYGNRFGNGNLCVTDAILISGVYDLEPIALVPVNDALQLTAQEIDELSPVFHQFPESVRVRVTAGEGDTGEFIRQSRDYAERLRKDHRHVTFDLQRGRHHYDIIMRRETFQMKP